MRHTISVLVENKFGVLSRIAGLFSGRGYNIESLTVGPTHDQTMSKMTIVTSGDDAVLEQIEKQLTKLVEVLKVTDLTGSGFVARELMLLKIKATPEKRAEIIAITDVFKANVVHVDKEALVLEATGRSEKIDALIALMEPYGIIELARTGKVALARSGEPTEKLAPAPKPPAAAAEDLAGVTNF
ncbi:MAG: acetolactate synthase small subunit [Lentisphaeria bacterium]|jgi:acetolactate synthase-1/3 small subunit